MPLMWKLRTITEEVPKMPKNKLRALEKRANNARHHLLFLMRTQTLFMDEDVLDDAWRRNEELRRMIMQQQAKKRPGLSKGAAIEEGNGWRHQPESGQQQGGLRHSR